VLVLDVPQEHRHRRRPDRGEDVRQLVALLAGERAELFQRAENGRKGGRAELRQGEPGPVVDRGVRAPEVVHRLGEELPLPHGREHLLELDDREERLERQ
jgi:hypothetical protein